MANGIPSLDDARRRKMQQVLYADEGGPVRKPIAEMPEPTHAQWTHLAGGKSPNGEPSGWWADLKAYWKKKIFHDYVPIKSARGGFKFLYYGGLSYLLKKISPAEEGREGSVLKSLIGNAIDSWSKIYDQRSEAAFFEFSPMTRLFLVYSAGKTLIDRVYVYHYKGEKIPIHFKTLSAEEPTKEALDKGIDHVNTYKRSPYDKMEKGESSNLLNMDGFVNIAADEYTGGAFKKWYGEEPTSFLRAFVKEETKGNWEIDANADIDKSLAGTVSVYKRPVGKEGFWYWLGKKILNDGKPRSGTMLRQNIAGDLGQDVGYRLTGADGLAHLFDKLGFTAEGIRKMLHGYYKIGSKFSESIGGGHRQFTYESAEARSYKNTA